MAGDGVLPLKMCKFVDTMTINLLIELLNLSTVMKQRIYTLTLLLMAFALGAMAQLRLPAIISDTW